MAEKRKNAFRYNLFIRKKAREEKLRMTPVIHYRLHKLRKKLNERYIIRFFQFATTKNGNVATRLSRPEFRSSTFFPSFTSYRTNFPMSIARLCYNIPKRIFFLRCL